MTVVLLAALAAALLSAIQTIDDREKADSYKLVGAWVVAAFGLYAIILHRGNRRGATGQGVPRDRE